MFNNIFKIVYFIEFIVIVIVRKIFTAKYEKIGMAVDKKTITDIIMLALNGIGMVVPLFYIFSSRLDFADYYLPGWIGWAGSVLFAVSIFIHNICCTAIFLQGRH